MPIIRTAERRDARQLAELAESTFRATFGALNTAADMQLHCARYYGESIQAREIADPACRTLVSEQAERLVGFAQLRWQPAPACVSGSAPGEIQRLYVAAEWHGKGVARELMNTCLATLHAHGSDVVWLGVWEHNERALAFYRKFGFVAVGDHLFPVGTDPQRDILMARSL